MEKKYLNCIIEIIGDNLPFKGLWHLILGHKIRIIGLRRAKLLSIKYSNHLKLDLGSGSVSREGFIGIDINKGADIQWDILWGLPFDDNSVNLIRSDHFFEHLELIELIDVLKECRRVLKPGASLDFTVPHINPYLNAYLNDDYTFLKKKIRDIPKGQEEIYNTCFDRIAWLLNRSGEHRSIFDRNSIVSKVKLAGFSNVIARDFNPQIDQNYRFSSIYITAIK